MEHFMIAVCSCFIGAFATWLITSWYYRDWIDRLDETIHVISVNNFNLSLRVRNLDKDQNLFPGSS